MKLIDTFRNFSNAPKNEDISAGKKVNRNGAYYKVVQI